jgi:hypothetical protein
MRLTITIDDTLQGIRALVDSFPNGVTDHMEDSLAFKVVGNWAGQLKELDLCHALVVEHVKDTEASSVPRL